MPAPPPYFPAAKGLYMQPTIVNNVETLSNLPWLFCHGVDEYRSIGTETSPGTRLVACRVTSTRRASTRSPGQHHLPRSCSSPSSTATASAAVASSRCSSPAARRPRGSSPSRSTCPRGCDVGAAVPCWARAPSSSWTTPPTRSRPACGSCGSSPASPAASARRAERAPPGRRRSSSASPTATAARRISTCCSTWPTTSAPGRTRWRGPLPGSRRRAVPPRQTTICPLGPSSVADHLGAAALPPEFEAKITPQLDRGVHRGVHGPGRRESVDELVGEAAGAEPLSGTGGRRCLIGA